MDIAPTSPTAAAAAQASFLPAADALVTIPLGRDREPSVVHDVRTPQQRAVILDIAARRDFDFACTNPCSSVVAEFVSDDTTDVVFLWYSIDGKLHLARIAADGDIVREITAGGVE